MSTSKPKRQGRAVPWSYSSLQQYETCPRRFYLTRIAKVIEEPQTESTTEGRRVHEAMEHAVSGKKPLPEVYSKYQPIVDKLRATPGVKQLEYKFALTNTLQPCDYWDSAVWVRGVLDVGIVRKNEAIILDYKTGKRKLDVDQLRLFALAGLSLWPQVETVKTGYIWLQQGGKLDREVLTRDQKVEIHQDFAMRVHRMVLSEEKNDWPPRPSGLCREWCPVGRALCEHCGK